jgi:hypothetical protein
VKISDSPKRVFKVVDKADAQDEVKNTEVRKARIFRVFGKKGNLRVTSLSLLDVLIAAVYRDQIQPAIAKKFGEVSDPASDIDH